MPLSARLANNFVHIDDVLSLDALLPSYSGRVTGIVDHSLVLDGQLGHRDMACASGSLLSWRRI